MKIGLCTGGGDCPGLNAAIRAVVKQTVRRYNGTVVGIKDSLNGLFTDPLDVRSLELEDVTDILYRGGTILGTYNRGDLFHGADRETQLQQVVGAAERLGLDGLIIIGGEGTQTIAHAVHQAGLPVIGIPKTIDNDLPGCDQSIGFSTCVDLVAAAVERLQSTAESHDRVMVLEVMGRDSGYIALHGGLAGGAHVILLPEVPYALDAIADKVQERKRMGRNYSVLVVSEGAFPIGGQPVYATAKNLGGIGQQVATELSEKVGMESRYTVLGHLQRGGSPNPADRLLATRLGVHAVDLAAAGKWGQIAVFQNGQLAGLPYDQLTPHARQKIDPSDPMVTTAEAIGICVGR